MGLGNGTTITFGTSGFTANVRRIGGANETRAAIDDSHLGTTGQMTSIPDQLTAPGETELEFEWDQSFSTFPPIDAVAETVTISYPLKSGETVKGTETGTAFLTEAKSPDVENGSLMIGRAVVHWDGKTDRTYTAGS